MAEMACWHTQRRCSVLSIITYEDEDDAVRIANDTVYGLHAGVYGADAAHASKVARPIQAGQVDVNGTQYNPLAPFGGYKQSGLGRESAATGSRSSSR